MKFNPANFSVQNEIDRRVQLEAWKEWAAKPTPPFEVIPDTTHYEEPTPPLLAVYNFAISLRP